MTEGIIIAVIVGGLALLGNVYTSNKTHSNQETKQQATIEMIQAEYKASIELIKAEFKANCDSILDKIKQLEKKQDKHNGLMEKVYKAEAHIETLNCKVESLEKRKSA